MMVVLHVFKFFCVLLLVPAWETEDYIFSDAGTCLLQTSTRIPSIMLNTPATAAQQVRISPLSDAIKFVGRYDVARSGEFVRFDAVGFEVQFRISGATEVKALIGQEINGPYGWYSTDDPTPEDVYADGCHASKKIDLSEVKVDHRIGLGGEYPGSQPHHFLVYVDGKPQLKPLMKSQCDVCTFDTAEAIDGQAMEYTLARGLDPSKSYDIRVVKTSEPDFNSAPQVPNWLALHSIILDSGDLQQTQDLPRTRKIEFLGDSMMSGFCNTCKGTVCHDGPTKGSNMGGEPPSKWRWGTFALAWPHLLCEELEADCHATVMSGTGMHVQAWQDSDDALPHYWRRTLATDSGTEWDFHTWTPDVFMMQVASHDYLPGDWTTYEDLFDMVHGKYPGVPIVLICGPWIRKSGKYKWNGHLIEDAECSRIQGLIDNRQDRAAAVHMLAFSKSAGSPDFNGCCLHPDEDSGKFFKDKAVEKLNEVMGPIDSW